MAEAWEVEEPSIHPIDTDKLVKGQDISPAECERIIGVSPADQSRYRLALLALAQWVMKDSEARGRPLSVGTCGDGIRVRTDQEASDHHFNQALARLRGFRRDVRRQTTTVDTAGLTPSQVQEHDHKSAVLAAYALRLQQGRRALKPADDKPQLPTSEAS